MWKHKFGIGIFVLLVFTYAWFMLISPFMVEFSMSDVMLVWYKWQGFNVGILALFATIFAYLSANLQRFERLKRDRKVAIARMSFSLSELTSFLRSVSSYWLNSILDGSRESFDQSNLYQGKNDEVLLKCISVCDEPLASNIAEIFQELQIIISRLEMDPNIVEVEYNKIVYLAQVVDLENRIGHLFGVARGQPYTSFDYEKLDCKIGSILFSSTHSQRDEIATKIKDILDRKYLNSKS